MDSDLDDTLGRRAVLAGVVGATAGCGAFGGGGAGDGDGPDDGGGGSDGTPTPNDAGTESYGIRAVNKLDQSFDVSVEITPAWEDEVYYENGFTLDATADRTFGGVLTDEGEFAVDVALDSVDGDSGSDGLWIDVGKEDSPDVRNLRVRVRNGNRSGTGDVRPEIIVFVPGTEE